MVEIDIDFEDRYRFRNQDGTLGVLKNSTSKYTCKDFKILDKRWPTIYVIGATAAQWTTVRQSNGNPLKRKIPLRLKGLVQNSLKQCAFKKMLANPKITWERITTHLIKKYLSYAMSADGVEFSSLNDNFQNIEKQLKSVQEALQSHSVNALNLNSQNPWVNQSFTRFCKLCRTEWHTVMHSPRKQNQSNFHHQFFIANDKKTLEIIPTEIFVYSKKKTKWKASQTF